MRERLAATSTCTQCWRRGCVRLKETSQALHSVTACVCCAERQEREATGKRVLTERDDVGLYQKTAKRHNRGR